MKQIMFLSVLTLITAFFTSKAQAGVSALVGATNGCEMTSSNRIPCLMLVGFTCSPEVAIQNTQTTDKMLRELAKSEFSNNKKFIEVIEQISQMKTEDKVSAYLGLAGVESNEDVAEFLGSRDGEIKDKHIQSLSQKTGLSKDQSKLALQTIAAGILGSRK